MNEYVPTDRDAVIAADTLLVEIIRSQPNLIPTKYADAGRGKEASEFVAAFRTGLIEMFKKQP